MLLLLVDKKAQRQRARDDTPDRVLVCSACRRRITSESHAIERGGAHAHTFVNPFGVVHHLRCFARATGIRGIGRPSTEFTWFPGHTWQILDCTGCAGHIGWRFRGPTTFYGLLRDRLANGDGP